MDRSRKIILIISLVGVFFLVYFPHWSYSYPYHVDEWHHISEAVRLSEPSNYFHYLSLDFSRRFSGLEIGFHALLAGLSKAFDLVSYYQFLPAFWAMLGALALFYVVYKKTGNSFLIAWLSLIFFASIRSNTNLTGLWFFTPLSFSIPFIFLYFYFFEEGVKKNNLKNIIYALLIMVCLIPFHPLSVVFALPVLLIYSLINYRFWLKNKIALAALLGTGFFGLIFFSLILKLDFSEVMPRLLHNLIFIRGWGVYETNNSFLQVYTWAAFLFAVLGVIYLFKTRKLKENLLFVIWPAYLLIMIFIYKLSGISFISPFQRNLYYFTIALPFLSAYGFYYLTLWLEKKGLFKTTILIFSLPILLVIIYSGYYTVQNNLRLYKVIDRDSYNFLRHISSLPPSVVMANIDLSTALYPITRHEPVGSIAFYGNRRDVEAFYSPRYSCDYKKKLLAKHAVNYFILQRKDNCALGKLLYNELGNYIYQVNK